LIGGIELVTGIMNRAGDNIGHFAHLGGMLFGFILIMIWKKKSRKQYYP
jgi:membrane associated rhomboid family serine protease